MGNTSVDEEVDPMPWETVTVREQKQQFIEDYLADYYSVSELAERFSVSRKTAHKWINRFAEDGKKGLEDRDRRPASCPWSTDEKVRAVILGLKGKHPN